MDDSKPLFIPGIGLVKQYLSRKDLPTIRRVLQVFFYFHRKEHKTVHQSSVIVSNHVIELYDLKGVRVQRTWLVQKKIRDLYTSWRSLQKNFKKTGECYDKMRVSWDIKMDQVFNIAHQVGHPSSPQLQIENGKKYP